MKMGENMRLRSQFREIFTVSDSWHKRAHLQYEGWLISRKQINVGAAHNKKKTASVLVTQCL